MHRLTIGSVPGRSTRSPSSSVMISKLLFSMSAGRSCSSSVSISEPLLFLFRYTVSRPLCPDPLLDPCPDPADDTVHSLRFSGKYAADPSDRLPVLTLEGV